MSVRLDEIAGYDQFKLEGSQISGGKGVRLDSLQDHEQFQPQSESGLNLKEDIGNFARGVARPFADPMGNLKDLVNTAGGVIQKIPGSPIGTILKNAPGAEQRDRTINAVGDQLSEQYGSGAAIENSVMHHPFRTAMEAGALALGGKQLVGMAEGKVNALRNSIASHALSPEFSPDKAAFKYGHDARRVMVKYPELAADDVNGMSKNLQAKIEEVGQGIPKAIESSPNAGNKYSIEEAVLKPINDKISELNKVDPASNAPAVSKLRNIKMALQHSYDENGQVLQPANLDSMSPKEIFDYRKSKIDKLVKFTGRSSDDADVNSALQESRRNIKNKMNEIVPELKPLNQDYGDLQAADEAVDKLNYKAQKEGLPLKIEDIISMGAVRFLNNPANKVKFAQWMYVAPQAEKQSLFSKIPDLKEAVQKAFQGQPELNMAGKAGSEDVVKVNAEVMPKAKEPLQIGRPSRVPIMSEDRLLPSPRKAGQSSGPDIPMQTAPENWGPEKDPNGFLAEAKKRLKGNEGSADIGDSEGVNLKSLSKEYNIKKTSDGYSIKGKNSDVSANIIDMSYAGEPKSAYIDWIESHSKGQGEQLIKKLQSSYDKIYFDATSKEGAALAKKTGFKLARKSSGEGIDSHPHGGFEWNKFPGGTVGLNAAISTGVATTASAVTSKKKEGQSFTGEASTYGWGEKGLNRTTMDGKKFEPLKSGVAMRGVPIGAVVEVKDLKTGKTIETKVVDGGPGKRTHRVVDLTQGAWRELGYKKPGLTNVTVKIKKLGTGKAYHGKD